MKMIIKNGNIIDPEKNCVYKGTICIKDGKIEKIVPSICEERHFITEESGISIIDAEGLMIGPGMVDTHVHFRDPGFTYKEDIHTGANAAKKGGYTQVVMMANTNPHIDNVETLKYVLEKGKETGIKVHACGNVTMDMKGEILTNMEELYENGAVGFTDDGVPLVDENICGEAMKRCALIGVPISFHEENPKFIENNGVNRGKASEFYGIGGSSREAEIDLIKRDIDLAKKINESLKNAGENATKCYLTQTSGNDTDNTNGVQNNDNTCFECENPCKNEVCLVIQHISTAEGVELVREGKLAGLDIHAEATPHHFALNEEAVIEFGTNAKMNPPLRTEEDRKAIIDGLSDGTIDLIATDHAPHSLEEKAKEITQAPSGIIGLETALSLSVKELVDSGRMTYPELFSRNSLAPCKLYGLDGGVIKEGMDADMVIFDPNSEWTVKKEEIASKASNTPFLDKTLKGVVKYTICRGEIVYQG